MSEYDGEIRIITKIDDKNASSQLLSLENRMAKTARKADALSKKMTEFSKQKFPTDEYVDIQKQIERAKEKLNALNAKMEQWLQLGKSTDSTSFKKMQMDAEELVNTIKYAEGEKLALEESGGAFIKPEATDEYLKMSMQAQDYQNDLTVLAQKHEELIAKQNEVGSSGATAMKKISDSAKKSTNRIGKMTGMIKNMLLSMVVFQVAFKGIEYLREGIENLARGSAKFNSTMSQMASATATLKNSLATAFAPIITMITPAIVTLCGWITKAVNLINRLISALTGKKTWTKATTQQVNYAKSLGDTAAAAKKAAGALQSFDELNVINSQDSTGGSGKGGEDYGSMFEEVPLTDKDFAWAEKLKNIFEAILPIATAIGAALLTWKLTSFLTDLMKTHPILGTILSILSVIAGIALMVVSYFHMWNDGVDWKGLIGYIVGASLAFAGLYALFGPFAAGLALIVVGIAGFVLALKDIYQNGINVKNVTLLIISTVAVLAGIFFAFGSTVALAVVGILGVVTAILSFVEMLKSGFSWLNEIIMIVGIAIAAIVAVILGVPAAVAAAVAAIVAVILTIIVVVKEHWGEICEFFSGVGEWFNENVIQPIIGFFKGLWEKVSGFFSQLWGDITGIWSTVSGWFSQNVIEPVVGFFQGLWTRVQQIFEGLWIIVQAVWIIASSWFNENVITPIVNFFKGLWEKVSGFFSQLWTDISESWSTVSTWFDENVVQPVSGFFKGLWEKVSGYFSSLWEDIKKVWDKVAGWFDENIITPVSGAFKTACEAIEGFFGNLWSGIKSGVVEAMNAVIVGIESAINFIVDGINKIIGGFNKVVSWAAKVADVDWGGVDLVPNVTLPRVALANGGITTGETIAKIGDNPGGKEAVLPLSSNTGWMDTLASKIAEQMPAGSGVEVIVQPDPQGIFKVVRNEANNYYRRTGNPAFDY